MSNALGCFCGCGTEAHGRVLGSVTSRAYRRVFATAAAVFAFIAIGCSTSARHSAEEALVDDAGGSTEDAGARTDNARSDASVPPKPNSAHPECILSADCPDGLHCDLGECVQDCNTKMPCASSKTCSARARCLDDNEDDVDPTPPSENIGTLEVSPPSVALTRANNGKTINLTLSTKSTQEVHYRAQVNAPYLSIGKLRGSFFREAILPIKVDTSNIVGRDIPGTVTLYTTLGTTVVSLPLHAGLTGRYHGSLRYNGGAVPLGDTRFDIELIEKNGDLTARVDPENSVLFPQGATSDDVAYGSGTADSDGTVALTIGHVLGATVAGAQTVFGRPIGRLLILRLSSVSTGVFEGAFSESIYGLFQNPVTTTGVAHLEYIPDAQEPNFQTKSVSMPTLSGDSAQRPLSMGSVFHPGESSPCGAGHVSPGKVLTACYEPLMASVRDVNTQYSALSEACKLELGLLPPDDSDRPHPCGCVTYAACAMGYNSYSNPSENNLGAEQGALVANLVAPAAIVAQEEMVAALRDSVANGKGLSIELAHYETALSALTPVAKWLMQPGMLEFFRNIPAQMAEESPKKLLDDEHSSFANADDESFPLARALGRVVQLFVEVNAERQRVASAETTMTPDARRIRSQNDSLASYFQAMALLGVLDSWAVSPPNVAGSVTGVLTKLDHAFADMTQDLGDTLGAPKRHVPFVFRPDDTVSGTTNFEQKLTIAAKAVSALQAPEQDFISDDRQVNQALYTNQTQLENTRSNLDQQVKDICGNDFSLDPTSGVVDWTKCGANSGTLAEVGLEIETAQTAALVFAQRAQGQKDKIDIDIHLVAEKKRLRDDELVFMSDAGQTIVANTYAIGMISAVQEMISVASNSNLWNAGAPAVASVASYGLGLEKAGLEADNEALRQAVSMTAQATDADIEYKDGMANIKREQIDLAEIVIEARQGAIGILQSQLKFANTLMRAQELYSSRTRTNQLIATDPSMDPAYRLVRNRTALIFLNARQVAQQELLEAGRALEYEMNYELPTLETAVQSARNQAALSGLQSCLDRLFDQFNGIYGTPQPSTTTVSIRKLFGIHGPRLDEVTGATLSEGEQFRAYVLNNQALDASGSLRIRFSTNLMPGNALWSTDTCNDKITEVQAQLVGDFLGDNEAEVRLDLSGNAVLRACDTRDLREWSLDTDQVAVIQAGVNTFADVTNTALFGQSVARATWTLEIRGGDLVPANRDVDVTKLDDIVLKIKHRAIATTSTIQKSLDDTCLAQIINN